MGNPSFSQGDTRGSLVCDISGGLVDAAVFLQFRKPDGSTFERQATVTDVDDGIWQYEWVVGDLDQAGKWRVRGVVLYQSGQQKTFGPNVFHVNGERSVPVQTINLEHSARR
jgi:hypothetical protein